MGPRARRRLLGAVAGVVAVATLASCGSDPVDTGRPARKVLVFSLPGVSWDDVRQADLPNLDALLRTSAVGAVSTRIGNTPASTTAAYLTLGSGVRAVQPGVDTGVALNPGETHAGIKANDILFRRLGELSTDGIAYIPVGAAIDANVRSPYGAVPGMLGDRLDAAGVARAVIANADAAEGFPTDEPPADGAFARSAATAMMGSDGIVPGGSVGRELLTEDPSAPFGRRLDPVKVADEFERAWNQQEHAVVLVEASDLSRAAAYRPRSTRRQAGSLRARALQDADDLLGRLLKQVDPERDAVLVVSPLDPSGLGVVALRAPDVDHGLLRSATTRRDGYVYLADVAPTILTLVGERPPASIEGRPFDVAEAHGNRIDLLVRESDDAAARDARLPELVPLIIGLLVLLTAAAVGSRRSDRFPAWTPRAIRPLAIGALGLVPGTFLAGQVEATRGSYAAYLAVVAGIGAVVGAVGWLAERRWPGVGPLVGLGSILAVIGGDVLFGAPLQVNTVFGYSMAVAGRFTGLGNLAFALFAAAAVTFAVVLVDRFGRRAVPVAVAVLVGAVLIDGLPMLGADVGGVVSLVPAFILTVLVLLGRRLRWQDAAAAVAVAFVVVIGFGLIDSARSSDSQTHLARLGEHAADGRLATVDDIILRRLHASFGATKLALWTLCLGLVLGALAQSIAVARGLVGPRATWLQDRTTRAVVVGVGSLAALGLVANDSSVAVPATMLIVLVPVVLLLRVGRPTGSAVAEPGDAPLADPDRALEPVG